MARAIQDAIVLFGDSITEFAWDVEVSGFGARLTNAYARKLDVINRGFSGYNTEWALPVLKQCLAPHEHRGRVPTVKLLVVWFGANDACDSPSVQHVPLDRYCDNIRAILDTVQSPESEFYSPATKVILITPPPINTLQWDRDDFRRFENPRDYAEGLKVVGKERNVPVLDAWTPLWKAAGEDMKSLDRVLSDGLHLNAGGYKVFIIYDGLMGLIDEVYPQLHYSRLQETFTLWGDVDPTNLADSLKRRTP
ncbi:SGNH hydrolase [Pluteus cervinus]|uniref:SGNH hydrolase n=1 Tax=Pluteus cervinus TaxID=181527 RepID=A0ACD3B3G1_9AGAR|nr:SGNH hydrolase [Pluteus cervinus]